MFIYEHDSTNDKQGWLTIQSQEELTSHFSFEAST